MRIEYIKPFVEEVTRILEEVTGLSPEPGELSLVKMAQPVMGVVVMVGLAGDVEGRVLFDMSEDVALDIASRMNGEQMTELDEMALSTVSELGNMVMGSVLSRLEAIGFNFDITPPTVMTGANMSISSAGGALEALVFPLTLPSGVFEMNVAVKERG